MCSSLHFFQEVKGFDKVFPSSFTVLTAFFYRISNLFGLSITKAILLVEMRIWCIKIGIVLALHTYQME
jgi:hypothetical protein